MFREIVERKSDKEKKNNNGINKIVHGNVGKNNSTKKE